MQANDMIDRMRTNVTATTLGVNSPYNNPAGNATGNPNCLGIDGSGNAGTYSCTFTQMAQHDFYEWFANLSGAAATGWYPSYRQAYLQEAGLFALTTRPMTAHLPGALLVIMWSSRRANRFAVKIWWVERKDIKRLEHSINM